MPKYALLPPPLAARHQSFISFYVGDNLLKYGWTSHDGTNFGMQDIAEKDYNIRTDFVKRPGGNHGGDWTWKISSQKVGKIWPVISFFKEVISFITIFYSI